MSDEHHTFFVKTAAPPSIEVDTQAASVYVRFKKASVAKTVPQPCESMHLAVDLDSHGEVIGIEAVGLTGFSIHSIMEKASVQAPKIDFSRARYVPAEFVEA
jgi:uncharacterized protein YuzE